MAVDHKDPDGDSAMTSSIDSIRDDRAGARTPTGNAQASTTNPSEISPPGSQTQGIGGSTTVHRTPLGDLTGQPESSANPLVGAWRTKRAQEDYQRAMEFVIDKGFSLAEFGDPYDERELNADGLFPVPGKARAPAAQH